MKSIQSIMQVMQTVLGTQMIEESAQYRRITFCVLTEADGVCIAYNTLTGEVVELTAEEADLLQSESISVSDLAKPLIEHWFFVPIEHDDIQLVDETRAFFEMFGSDDGIHHFTIFTTMDCNARCFYCFELGKPRTPMSFETAQETVNFIKKHRSPKKKVKISWFGGEPLCNWEVVDFITSELSRAEIDFFCSMITNGYLFDDFLAKKAAGDWNLKWVQITLDGTRDVYNKIKAYVDCEDKDPFAIVTDNIERLLKNGIEVRVRMNMGMHNKEDLYVLADFLATRYKGYDLFSAYTKLLFEDDLQTPEMQMLLADELLAFEEYCDRLGLMRPKTVREEPCVNRCMADSGNSIVITPSGKLGKCEHFSDTEHVGSVWDGITNPAKIKEFKVRVNSRALCSGCPAYPVCIRLPKCSIYGSKYCYPASRKIEAAHLSRAACNTYRKFKEQQKKKAE